MQLVIILSLILVPFVTGQLYELRSEAAATTELLAVDGGHCACHKSPTPSCGCCQRIKFHVFKLKVDDKVCISASLLTTTKKGIEIQVLWDGHSIFKKDIIAKIPQKLCFRVPFVPMLKACIDIDHISLEPHHHGACANLVLEVWHVKKKFKIGCFYGSVAMVADGGPADEAQDLLEGLWKSGDWSAKRPKDPRSYIDGAFGEKYRGRLGMRSGFKAQSPAVEFTTYEA